MDITSSETREVRSVFQKTGVRDDADIFYDSLISYRRAQIEYTFSNTSPLYDVDFTFNIREPSSRSLVVLGNRQLAERLRPHQSFIWEASAMQITQSAPADCLEAWDLRASVGCTIDGQWLDRATFTIG